MLLIKAKGGLGNRVLSAASFILYAELTGKAFKIDWRDGIYANNGQNSYDLLFEKNFENNLNQLDLYADNVIPKIWQCHVHDTPSQMIQRYFPRQHSNPFVYRKLSSQLVPNVQKQQLQIVWSYTSKTGRVKKFLNSNQNLQVEIKRILLKYFSPNADIENELKVFFTQNVGKTLAVHIRHTDLKVSYLRVFKQIEECVKRSGYDNIFLSTDSREIEKLAKAKFDNVVTINKRYQEGGRQLHSPINSPTKLADAKAAVFDLIALSRCDGLIYSSRSSFSRLSVLLGRFDKNELFDIDHYNVKSKFKNRLQEYL